MGGSPSNARIALFELMRGVNERQAAIGITKTQFYKTDGTQAADLSMADILNIRASGVESNVEKNLKLVQSAIKALIATGYFVTASGGDTAYTESAIEAAIGTNLDTTPLRMQEARFWQAQKDALDLLIYCRRGYGFTYSSATVDQRGASGSLDGWPTSADDAWSLALAKPPTTVPLSVSTSGLYLSMHKQYVDPPGPTPLGNYYGAAFHNNVQGMSLVINLLGDLVNFYYNYTVREVVNDTSPAPLIAMPVIINSTSFSNTPSGNSHDTTFTSRVIGDPLDITLSGTYPMGYTIDLPSTAPWEPSLGNSAYVELDITSVTVYWDLDSVLSDQAP